MNDDSRAKARVFHSLPDAHLARLCVLQQRREATGAILCCPQIVVVQGRLFAHVVHKAGGVGEHADVGFARAGVPLQRGAAALQDGHGRPQRRWAALQLVGRHTLSQPFL